MVMLSLTDLRSILALTERLDSVVSDLGEVIQATIEVRLDARSVAFVFDEGGEWQADVNDPYVDVDEDEAHEEGPQELDTRTEEEKTTELHTALELALDAPTQTTTRSGG